MWITIIIILAIIGVILLAFSYWQKPKDDNKSKTPTMPSPPTETVSVKEFKEMRSKIAQMQEYILYLEDALKKNGSISSISKREII